MLLLKNANRYLHTSAVTAARGPVAHGGWFPRDHMPGPYPRTEDERRAAAIKYGMRPEDYEAHHPHDFVNHIGDYPNIGIVAYEQRDPYEAYSDNSFNRNWGEVVPRQFVRYRYDRWSYTGLDEEDFEFLDLIKNSAMVLVPMFLFYVWVYRNPENDKLLWLKTKMEPKWKTRMMPKQYSYDFFRAFPYEDPKTYPILNYSFEPADDGFDSAEAEAKHPFNDTSLFRMKQ